MSEQRKQTGEKDGTSRSERTFQHSVRYGLDTEFQYIPQKLYAAQRRRIQRVQTRRGCFQETARRRIFRKAARRRRIQKKNASSRRGTIKNSEKRFSSDKPFKKRQKPFDKKAKKEPFVFSMEVLFYPEDAPFNKLSDIMKASKRTYQLFDIAEIILESRKGLWSSQRTCRTPRENPRLFTARNRSTCPSTTRRPQNRPPLKRSSKNSSTPKR